MIVRTVLNLNPKAPEVVVDMRDCNAMHRRVMSMFSHVRYDRVTHHILYRVEGDEEDGATLLLHSNVIPDVSVVPLRYTRQNADVDAFYGVQLRDITAGMTLPFRLRTMTSKRESQSGKRVPIKQVPQQIEWLARKGHDHGFAVVATPQVINSGIIYGYRGVNQAPMHYFTTTFAGMLEVTDPLALYQAVQQGIGTGKAHGLGLLEVRI